MTSASYSPDKYSAGGELLKERLNATLRKIGGWVSFNVLGHDRPVEPRVESRATTVATTVPEKHQDTSTWVQPVNPNAPFDDGSDNAPNKGR